MKYDVVVIGSGPAGITSAIYAKRSGLSVCVIGKKESNLLKADWVDNYYGFPGGISGEELFNNGIKQAIKLGVSVFNDEVLEIEWFGEYNVKTVKNEFSSKTVIMATGNKKNTPKIKGIKDSDISYLAAHAEKEANPLYPVPKLLEKKELEEIIRKVQDWSEE
jgi:thioredoxin reductase (NADPH)